MQIDEIKTKKLKSIWTQYTTYTYNVGIVYPEKDMPHLEKNWIWYVNLGKFCLLNE